MTTTSKARILVVDDHPLFRQGVAQLLNRQDNLTCCGEADCVAAVVPAVVAQKPDLVLLDLRLGHGDGLELIKSLKAQFPSLAILVLSQHDEALYAERTLRAGALGYVTKEEATDEILAAIRAVLAGDLYVSRSIAARVLRQFIGTPVSGGRSGVENLSDREVQVFQLIGAGLSIRRIAEELKLSIKTVESHRENIKHKLSLPSAADVARQATNWVTGQRTSSPSQDVRPG